MRLNNQNQITSPNQLILENAVIENIFYDMNSVVNLTKYGGYVQFLNTKFLRISICGAIVKNYYANFPLADFSYLTSSSGLSASQITFMEKLRSV